MCKVHPVRANFCSILYLVFLLARLALQGRMSTADSQIALWALKYLFVLYRYQVLCSCSWLRVYSIIFYLCLMVLDILPSLLSNILYLIYFLPAKWLTCQIKIINFEVFSTQEPSCFLFFHILSERPNIAFSGHQCGKEESTPRTPTFSASTPLFLAITSCILAQIATSIFQRMR